MAFVSSEAFCEITTELRKTGELSDGKIILDDGSEFKIHKILLDGSCAAFSRFRVWGVYLIINALQRVLREYVGFFPAPSVSRVSANLLTAV